MHHLPSLEAHLLGGFQLVYAGQPVTGIAQPRQQALLAYLMLHDHAPQPRRHLSFLFWPDSTEAQARTNLRYVLHQLRHAFPPLAYYLHDDDGALHWRPTAPFRLDVTEFAQLAAANPGSLDAQRAALTHAVALYRGELLPGHYDDWLLPRRAQLDLLYASALARLSDILAQLGDLEAAIGQAARLLSHDPTDETACRRLMLLHEQRGDRAGAVRVYHQCASALAHDLGVEPGPDTHSLYARILNQPGLAPAATLDTVTLNTVTADTVTLDALPAGAVVCYPLVGRAAAWQTLLAAFEATPRTGPTFVSIHGEAGIGKTRLAEELLRWAAARNLVTASARAYAAEGQLAYAPIAAWLRADPYRTRLARLEQVWLAELARILPELLAARPDLPAPQPLTESWQRQHLFEAIAYAILPDARPTVLHLDDLQWCDRDTLECVHYLLRRNPHAPLLVVCAVRDEEVGDENGLASWLDRLRTGGQIVEIELDPLSQTAVTELAHTVAGRALTAAELEALYQQTEGNPLFLVEMVHAGLVLPTAQTAPEESASAPALPPKVRAILHARLAQLSLPARQLAGLAAVIGCSFTFGVLAAASSLASDALVMVLDELWQRRIIREQGADSYDFSHDRLRDAAYWSLSKALRRQWHAQVAHALEQVYAEDLDSIYGQLAGHYSQAGMPAAAADYYRRAGEIAQRVFANAEAARHYRSGLRMLHQLPAGPERDAAELALLTGLGVCLVALEGYPAASVRETYARAHALCQQLPDAPSGPILRALAISYVSRDALEQGATYGQQLLDEAARRQDPALAAEAHYALGVARFWQGNFLASRRYLEAGIAAYDPAHQEVHLRLFGQDVLAVCQSRLAVTLAYLGFVEQARVLSQAALARAHALAHPFTIGYVLTWAAVLHCQLDEVDATLQTARAAVALSREHDLAFWLGLGRFLEGWALAQSGDRDGVRVMHEGDAIFRKTGALFKLSWFGARLAAIEAQQGEMPRALTRLDAALARVHTYGEEWCLSELMQQRGDLLAREGRRDDARRAYQEALAVAQRQHAAPLAQSAAFSLRRLEKSDSPHEQARLNAGRTTSIEPVINPKSKIQNPK